MLRLVFNAVSDMDASERAYYLRRALEEHEAARSAAPAEARERHEELAFAYRLRCRSVASSIQAEASDAPTEVHYAA